MQRDPTLRPLYLASALADIPRLLGAVDRNPYHATYGCLDRDYWHYRTAAFPSEMFQEGALALALVYATPLPGNRWHGAPRVAQLAEAGLRFSVASAHADGSCDDYYPYERALGAAVFSLHAMARVYELLGLSDPTLRAGLERRARWILGHGETGRLANHHALAALGLWHVGRITQNSDYTAAAAERVRRLLQWQSAEGWFEEYGGADPGYQTVTVDCLAKYRRLSGDAQVDEPLRRAVGFCRRFVHPDQSYGGPYGSRGTYHFYPHGFELLARELSDAADLADAYLATLAAGRQAHFSDDRMFAHRTADLLEAYVDWAPERPPASIPPAGNEWLPRAQLLVARGLDRYTVVSAARGGVFQHFTGDRLAGGDAGLIVETTDRRQAVSQMHDLGRGVTFNEAGTAILSVGGPLHWARFETATPVKQAIFHLGMITLGRWLRELVRRVLQRRLITGRRPCPIRLERRFELQAGGEPALRVTDTITLTDSTVRVRRMSYGTDHEAAYIAASGVYQDAVLRPWVDLAEYVDRLNGERRVTVIREF
jgi:hypothetical protein